MSDAEVDDIYRLVEAALDGGEEAVDIEAFPFRMTDVNMARHQASPWFDFWREIKRGYDLFEATRQVSQAGVRDGHYIVFAAGERPSPQPAQLITAWR